MLEIRGEANPFDFEAEINLSPAPLINGKH